MSNPDPKNNVPIDPNLFPILLPQVKPKNKVSKKIGKREVVRQLMDQNEQLKKIINELSQRIIAFEAQNRLLSEKLSELNSLNSKNDTTPHQ